MKEKYTTIINLTKEIAEKRFDEENKGNRKTYQKLSEEEKKDIKMIEEQAPNK